MIKLTATSAQQGLSLPAAREGMTISALPRTQITALAPYPGQQDALHEQLGGFPQPGEILTLGALRLVWAGRDLAFAFGDGLPDGLDEHCAMTDQSDGWNGFELQGTGAEALLSRRLPFDLRKMAAPSVARSVMDHMPVLVIRCARDRFEIWVWRSMDHSFVQQIMK